VIADGQNEKQRDQVNQERDDLAEKMGNRRLALLFPIRIPQIAIEECDEESGAQDEEGGADVVPPVDLDAVERGCGVERERETEKLEENTEAHAGLALKETAEGERREISRDENDRRHQRFLILEKLQHRRWAE
jgi:hypothetical protein